MTNALFMSGTAGGKPSFISNDAWAIVQSREPAKSYFERMRERRREFAACEDGEHHANA